MPASARTLDPRIARAMREFARRISTQYPVQKVILFGSRARGTERSDSDADVAVLLRGARGHFLDTKLDMVDVAYEVLLETEVHIQPVLFENSIWQLAAPSFSINA